MLRMPSLHHTVDRWLLPRLQKISGLRRRWLPMPRQITQRHTPCVPLLAPAFLPARYCYAVRCEMFFARKFVCFITSCLKSALTSLL